MKISGFVIPVLIFISAMFLVGTYLGKPFWGDHDWNGARYGNIARNYLRYGLIETKLGQVENGGLASAPEFLYYTHYQPLLPLLIAVSYKFWGVSEASTRLIPLLATGGLAVVIYLISKSLFSTKAGIFSAAAVIATPMLRYYGKNPVHEPLAVFFAALSFYGALLVKNNHRRGWFVLFAGLLFASLTNWAYVFLILGLTVFLFDKKYAKNLVRLWLLGIFMGILHFLHTYILTGSFFGGDLIGALMLRTFIDQSTTHLGIISYILRIRLWASTLFTNTLLFTGAVSLIFLLNKGEKMLKKFMLGVFIFSFYPVFFANASFIHTYFIYYFILPLGILAGYLFHRITSKNKILIILFIIIAGGIYMERSAYIRQLNLGDNDATAIFVGQRIKKLSKPDQKIKVEPVEYAQSRYPVLSFYSARSIVTEGESAWRVTIEGNSFRIGGEGGL